MTDVLSPKFRILLTKTVNNIFNSFLKKKNVIDSDIKFDVTVRRRSDTPFEGYNAGPQGEPYNYVIEINSDTPIPLYVEYISNSKKTTHYHISELTREIKELLIMMGVDTALSGKEFGIFFKNVSSLF